MFDVALREKVSLTPLTPRGSHDPSHQSKIGYLIGIRYTKKLCDYQLIKLRIIPESSPFTLIQPQADDNQSNYQSLEP